HLEAAPQLAERLQHRHVRRLLRRARHGLRRRGSVGRCARPEHARPAGQLPAAVGRRRLADPAERRRALRAEEMTAVRDLAADALFEHTRWVLALARRLVGDAAADDVAQQTMIAALQRPPAADRPLRPWLAQVARRFARKWSRGERRPRAHEQQAAGARAYTVRAAAGAAASR